MALLDGEVLPAIAVTVCVGVKAREDPEDGRGMVGLGREREDDLEVELDFEALELKKCGLSTYMNARAFNLRCRG
jgi:hypothetical protein